MHPCLWCTSSKQQAQRSATQELELPKRSLTDSIKRDRQTFRLRGENDIKKAKVYNIATRDPLFDVPFTHVPPLYLHILLGISKKHHDLLEKDCLHILLGISEKHHDLLEKDCRALDKQQESLWQKTAKRSLKIKHSLESFSANSKT